MKLWEKHTGNQLGWYCRPIAACGQGVKLGISFAASSLEIESSSPKLLFSYYCHLFVLLVFHCWHPINMICWILCKCGFFHLLLLFTFLFKVNTTKYFILIECLE